MSRDDIGKMLGPWLGKARKLAEPPQADEARGSLARREPVPGYGGGDDGLTQLNFKIPQTMKRRIKQLAVRDNITLLTMLHRMLELYEKEHGALGQK